ncbi:hypothetical protein [Mycobacterium deserti]|uniref:Mce associated membrane protein n=1 Tax=Mycobacterium deserti TaxID=2978347 RepID=A0ABT2MC26_9MYCO|nr:hypothetical protein [Mycobacterium deserti]MCT7658945.1 hypothetical protein [Mycobacterium deserti]
MEGDAGTRQLNPTDADASPDESLAVPPQDQTPSIDESEQAAEPDLRRVSRLGIGWMAGICAVLVLLAIGGAVGGYLALKAHQDSQAVAAADNAALEAAKACVAATHAPDTAAMTAAQSKIIECFTGDMTAQATLYSGVFVDAYQAADVKVAVSDMRGAVEKHNDDGTVDVLVAVRVKITNAETADQEQGYRLRLKMTPFEGAYKVADIDQVTS